MTTTTMRKTPKAEAVLRLTEFLTAGVVRAAGGTLLRVDDDGRRGTFVFADADGQASDILARHRAGNLTLPTRAVVDSILAVKSELFAVRPR